MEKQLTTALQAVRAASLICGTVQSQLVSADSLAKKDRSPVTVADYASQALICAILREQFPDIPIVGEENADALRRPENAALLERVHSFLPDFSTEDILKAIDMGNADGGDLFWTLDPIDGTKGFLRGEQYAVALALIEKGEIILGVLGCPNLEYKPGTPGALFYALRGEGAFSADFNLDSTSGMHVSSRKPEESVRFLESVEKGHANHGGQAKIMAYFGERKASVRVDSQVKYAVLARGDAEVYLRLPKPDMPDYREKIWDHAAGVIIVEEAGGIVTDALGAPLDFSLGRTLQNNRGVIGSNGQFHDLIVEKAEL